MWRWFGCLAAAVVLVSVPISSARAELCVIDAVPAATLLLPYFEVEVGKPKAKAFETIVGITNNSAEPKIAHVSVWTDLSVPTVNFDISLTGFDVEFISLKDLFFNGRIPTTFPDSDPGDCHSIGGIDVAQLANAHTGRTVGGSCYGTRSGNVARGYITIDVVQACSVIFPSDGGYFDDVADNTNFLSGEVTVFKKAFIHTEPLVHVEAGSFDDGDYTFYGRYTDFDGTDEREPLGATWGARYIASPSNFKPYFIVWRDSLVEQPPFDCDARGSEGWYPLPETQVVAFNHQEDFLEIEDDVFGAETQRVRVNGSPDFPAGWFFLNLNHGSGTAQSFVSVRQDFKKRRSIYPAHLRYDASDESPSVGHACGPAPDVVAEPIP